MVISTKHLILNCEANIPLIIQSELYNSRLVVSRLRKLCINPSFTYSHV